MYSYILCLCERKMNLPQLPSQLKYLHTNSNNLNTFYISMSLIRIVFKSSTKDVSLSF